MSCSCHGKSGVSVQKTSPYEQCTACARKHVKNAWSKWSEFTYEEDNRDYVSAQLRDAADHLKYIHGETALKLRSLAITIEENMESDKESVFRAIDDLRRETKRLFYLEHPEAEERLKKLKESEQ